MATNTGVVISSVVLPERAGAQLRHL